MTKDFINIQIRRYKNRLPSVSKTEQKGSLAMTTAAAAKNEWIRVLSDFVAFIPIH